MGGFAGQRMSGFEIPSTAPVVGSTATVSDGSMNPLLPAGPNVTVTICTNLAWPQVI